MFTRLRPRLRFIEPTGTVTDPPAAPAAPPASAPAEASSTAAPSAEAAGSAEGAQTEQPAPQVDPNDLTDEQFLEQRGYPRATPTDQMEPLQQAAYWKAMSRKHETAWRGKAGDYSPEQVAEMAAELETRRAADTPPAPPAAEQPPASTPEHIAPPAAPAAPTTASPDRFLGVAVESRLVLQTNRDDDAIRKALEFVDVTRFVNDAGDLDFAKVDAFAATIAAPAPAPTTPPADPTSRMRRTGPNPATAPASGGSIKEMQQRVINQLNPKN